MTYVDGHLVNMHALLDAKLGNVDVESSIENTDDLGLANDRAVALGKVVDKDAEEQMSRLLLSKTGRVLLAVDMNTYQ